MRMNEKHISIHAKHLSINNFKIVNNFFISKNPRRIRLVAFTYSHRDELLN
jgi:hypothetical protein